MQYRTYTLRGTLLLFFWLVGSAASGQTFPLPGEDPVSAWLQYRIAAGDVPLAADLQGPYTYQQLDSLVPRETGGSSSDPTVRYQNEFLPDSTPHFRLLKFRSDRSSRDAHVLTYADSSLNLKIHWEELWGQTGIPPRWSGADRVLIQARQGPITLFSQFTMYRESAAGLSVPVSTTFRHQSYRFYPDIGYLLWYQAQSGFSWTTPWGELTLGQYPLRWGPGGNTAPLLSGTAAPFPFFRLRLPYRQLQLDILQADLAAESGNALHQQPQPSPKHLAAQRLRWAPSPRLVMAYTEMVIYGHRQEKSYLLPVNFYWAEEHNLGDRDNVLMSLDLLARVHDRGIAYVTLVWDELQWAKLLQPWWGNKFVFQLGYRWATRLRSHPLLVSLQHTISRPWTFTHKDSVNTFTHLGENLGFPLGPSSRLTTATLQTWLSPRLYASLALGYAAKGSGLGSSVWDNYNDRDPALDENTPLLVGTPVSGWYMDVQAVWTLTPVWELQFLYRENQALGIKQSYLNLQFSW
ncbi:MAG: hypothetical protein D6762_08205 [Candidatus Neomarinimicrobiota bacterium]|nr:MAG: hypothetical protein D6762_08205 [Candidatus Neomarinimicrobiota bacterium]